MKYPIIILAFGAVLFAMSCKNENKAPKKAQENPPIAKTWETDFFDDFETFNEKNWQDQRIWVNNEKQCYVPDNAHGTSVAGRIASKNRKEFIKGRWTAKLKLQKSNVASMFPAWWILGAQNNEPPVQETNENICWPLTGSGEIDIFEHHGDAEDDHFTTGPIHSLDTCDKGDWWTLRTDIAADLEVYHEYAVEWETSDLVFKVDGKEVHRSVGEGDKYPEPMFAILNYAKITDSPMEGEWVMEVDWVKHEFLK